MNLYDQIMNLPCGVADTKVDSFKDYANAHLESREALVKQLAEALTTVKEDINWMLNSKQQLNGFVFDYIDAALAAVREYSNG